MNTFCQDCKLPALPVPELEGTCQNLKRLIKPLVDSKVYENSVKALDFFEKNQGQSLQTSLLQMADSDLGNASWLRPIWDDNYLSARTMLPINVNYTFKLITDRWGKAPLPEFMSALSRAIQKMRSESLMPEPSREGYLSMDTLACMIYTRVPGRVRDSWYYPPLPFSMTASVVCKGHWFIVSLTDCMGNDLSVAAIQDALSEIRERAEAMGPAFPVGILTCLNRTEASELREMIQAYPVNRLNLEKIERSLFTLCLDEPLKENERFNLRVVTGVPENRWFDKSLQIISAGENIGTSFEHSGCDAGIWLYLLNQADGLIGDGDKPQNESPAHILSLSWKQTEPLTAKLWAAAEPYTSAASRLTLSDKRMKSASKERLKAAHCSPDAFVQLLYQAAYYKLTGRFGSVYESVSSRDFYQGRTESGRPVTEESIGFIRAFYEGADKDVLLEKFHLAKEAHSEMLKRCQKGLGSERHMSGLLMLAQSEGESLPEIFSDEGFNTLRRNILSTSSLSIPCIDFFSFGPVVEGGVGIGYGIRSEALHVSVCAYDDSGIDPDKFIDEMENAAEGFFGLLE